MIEPYDRTRALGVIRAYVDEERRATTKFNGLNADVVEAFILDVTGEPLPPWPGRPLDAAAILDWLNRWALKIVYGGDEEIAELHFVDEDGIERAVYDCSSLDVAITEARAAMAVARASAALAIRRDTEKA